MENDPFKSDIPFDKILLSATVVFISGILIFTVIFKMYFFMIDMEKSVGISVNPTQSQSVIQMLALLPWVLGIIYALLVVAILIYITRFKFKKEEEQVRF